MQTIPFPRRRPTILTAAATAALLPLPAFAQVTRYYVGNGTPWNTPSSWSTSPAGPPGASIPANGDTASLSTTSNLTIPFNGNYLYPTSLAAVYLDGTGDATLTLSQANSSNFLRATNEYIGYTGHGAYDQSASANAATFGLYLGYNPGATGDYSLSAGILSTDLAFVGYSGSGTITQTGGTHSVSNSLDLGSYTGSTGTYVLSGAATLTVATSLDVGHYQGTGTFTQSGGLLDVHAGSLDVSAGSRYTLSGPATLTAGGDYLGGSFVQTGGTHSVLQGVTLSGPAATYDLSGSVSVLSVGASEEIGNSGTFIQSDGIHAIGSNLYLGRYAGSAGTYALSGTGSLTADETFVGYGGAGTFTQSGGTHAVTWLYVGCNSGSSGSYSLSDSGTLAVARGEDIGSGGAGTFSQSGGTHTVDGDLRLGVGINSSGAYALSGTGTLSVTGTESVGVSVPALFDQSGGQHTVGFLTGNSSSSYRLRGGTLTITQGLAFRGTLDCAGGPATLAAAGGILDLSAGTLANSAILTVTGSANSIILFPSGFNPATELAAFSTAGLAAHPGDSLTIPAGTNIIGQGTLTGHVDVAGALATPTGGQLDLNNGLSVRSNASASIRTLVVQDMTSSLAADGTLNVANNEYIGDAASGAFTQSGGTHSITSFLYVSHLPSSSGTFNLSAGLLRVGDDTSVPNDAHGYVLVGSQGTGTFVHSGGTLTMARTLRLGGGPGASGTYTLSGDALLSVGYTQFPGNELIGYYGAGSFTQNGGTNTLTGTLTLARNAGSSGTYTLSAGSLAAARTTINSNGTFSYTGGSASLGALALTGTGALLLSPGHDKTLLASSLSLASTATLDLSDNTLSLSSTPLDTVRSSLANHSLFSSTADADPRRALGYAGTSPLLVQLTVQGDANLDGTLDPDDYALLDRAYAKHLYNAHWTDGDFNYDGTITSADYLLIDTTYGQSHGLSPAILSQREAQFGPAYVSSVLAAVPEPGSLAACGFVIATLSQRLRRKSRS